MLLVIVTWLRSFYEIRSLCATYGALIKHTFLRLVKITSFLERMLVSELKKART